MVYGLLADACEAGCLGQIGDVSVHLAVNLDVLDHFAAIGLQSAVEVVQILDAAHSPGCGIEEFGGQCLREWVVAFLLVAAHQVVSLLAYHAVEGGYLVRRVLEVGVHGDDHISLGGCESAVKCRALAIVAAELDGVHRVWALGLEALDYAPRAVGAAVVHEYDFVTETVLVHHSLNPLEQFGQGFFFVVQGDDYRYIHLMSIRNSQFAIHNS